MRFCPLKIVTALAGIMLATTAGVAQDSNVESSSSPVGALSKPTRSQESNLSSSTYILGPDDKLSVRVLHIEEISEVPVLIGQDGQIKLPLVGRVQAAGRSLAQIEAELTGRLRGFVQEPEVTVSIAEFRSQPVSVLGAVNNPGVHQVRGNRTLYEILSLAGGLRPDTGPAVKITRQIEQGRLPLESVQDDASGQFTTAEVKLKSIMEAKNPRQNIVILANDVISVPRAQLIYVIGEVPKAGGYALNERESMSLLEALALAGGLARTASPQNAKVLRMPGEGTQREEIPVDLKKILASKSEDPQLQPDDILFVPGSTGKRAAFRAMEAAIGIGTGLAIYR